MPVEAGAQPDDFANDDDCRGLDGSGAGGELTKLDTSTRWASVVALPITAAGSSRRRPPAISRATMFGKCLSAI